MATVLIDNWSLHSFSKLTDKERTSSYNIKQYDHICWQNILMAIVLWDEIKYLPMIAYAGAYSQYIDELDATADNEKPFHGILSPLLDDESNPIEIKHINHELSHAALSLEYKNKNIDTTVRGLFYPNEDVFSRTFFYLAHSSMRSTNYLPHPIRAEFINNQSLNVFYDRTVLMETIDAELSDYYRRLNELIHRKVFCCNYPIIYDYIRNNCNSLADELNAAFDLRNDVDIASFRSCLDTLDEKVNSGNIESLDFAIQQIKDLSSQITNKYKKSIDLGELSIGLSPTIKFPLQLTKKRKEICLTFLTRLIDFGIHDRIKR